MNCTDDLYSPVKYASLVTPSIAQGKLKQLICKKNDLIPKWVIRAVKENWRD